MQEKIVAFNPLPISVRRNPLWMSGRKVVMLKVTNRLMSGHKEGMLNFCNFRFVALFSDFLVKCSTLYS